MRIIVVVGLIIVILMQSMTGTKVLLLQNKISDNKCSDIIDAIYEQCIEEGNVSISSTKGRNTYLENKFGVCVIRGGQP